MDYRIPKNKIHVKIATLFDDKLIDYFIYLNKFSRFQTGGETLEELLNSGKDFLPATNLKTELTDFISVKNVLYIIHDKNSHDSTKSGLNIYTINGLIFDVFHFEPLPMNHSRPLDALNNNRQFVPYIMENHIVYFNKDKIVKVCEV